MQICRTMLRLDWCDTFCLYVARQLGISPLNTIHPGWPPSPSPSSSDTSSWQPAPFNSLQHLLGQANHWCSAPTMATTPAPSLVELSHLGPYDGAFLGEFFLLPQTALGAGREGKKKGKSNNQWLEENSEIICLMLYYNCGIVTKTFIHQTLQEMCAPLNNNVTMVMILYVI